MTPTATPPSNDSSAAATGTPAPAPAQPGTPFTGYALPVPAALVTANPGWLDLSNPAAAATTTAATFVPAAPVVLPVPAGTEVDAVTAGTVAVGTGNQVTLTGTDGATYTYAGVTGSGLAGGPPSTVTAGQKIGGAMAGGITFAITVPDVAGAVCTNSALQAWSAGINVDVRSLPQTCLTGTAPATTPTAAQTPAAKVLVVTNAEAGTTATDVAGLLAGTQVTAKTLVLDQSQPVLAQVAQITGAESTAPNLIVFALAGTTPAEAAALVGVLPPSQQILWTIPPGEAGNPATVAAFDTVVAAHPNLRAETLPSALGVLTKASAGATAPPVWSAEVAKVTSAMAVRYAGTAYRLPLVNAQAAAVIAYAEAQLGKPYQWAAAGPATFDCSGLTMMAYRQIGMDFVHNAYAQYEATKANAVAADDLEPGDLVFFGPNEVGIHHVGIYLGNNEFLDAPETGTVVRIDTLGPGWDYFGATRPYATPSTIGTTGGALAATVGLDDNQAFAQAISDATWDPSQFGYLLQLWNRESGWDPTAINPTSGAYGIAQALPAVKMASVGSDWSTDAYTQILWGIDYIQARYGTPAGAWAHETAYGWY